MFVIVNHCCNLQVLVYLKKKVFKRYMLWQSWCVYSIKMTSVGRIGKYAKFNTILIQCFRPVTPGYYYQNSVSEQVCVFSNLLLLHFDTNTYKIYVDHEFQVPEKSLIFSIFLCYCYVKGVINFSLYHNLFWPCICACTLGSGIYGSLFALSVRHVNVSE